MSLYFLNVLANFGAVIGIAAVASLIIAAGATVFRFVDGPNDEEREFLRIVSARALALGVGMTVIACFLPNDKIAKQLAAGENNYTCVTVNTELSCAKTAAK